MESEKMTNIMNTLQQIAEQNLLNIEQAKAAGRHPVDEPRARRKKSADGYGQD
jgi:hypothetical protein